MGKRNRTKYDYISPYQYLKQRMAPKAYLLLRCFSCGAKYANSNFLSTLIPPPLHILLMQVFIMLEIV